MVDLSVGEGQLVLKVRGLDRVWSFKSRLAIPLERIRGARADPSVARGWWKGIRAPGTHIPGIIIAGTFYQDDKRIFWDVHDPEKTIIIDLEDDLYDQLIVEVSDPKEAVRLIEENARAES